MNCAINSGTAECHSLLDCTASASGSATAVPVAVLSLWHWRCCIHNTDTFGSADAPSMCVYYTCKRNISERDIAAIDRIVSHCCRGAVSRALHFTCSLKQGCCRAFPWLAFSVLFPAVTAIAQSPSLRLLTIAIVWPSTVASTLYRIGMFGG